MTQFPILIHRLLFVEPTSADMATPDCAVPFQTSHPSPLCGVVCMSLQALRETETQVELTDADFAVVGRVLGVAGAAAIRRVTDGAQLSQVRAASATLRAR